VYVWGRCLHHKQPHPRMVALGSTCFSAPLGSQQKAAAPLWHPQPSPPYHVDSRENLGPQYSMHTPQVEMVIGHCSGAKITPSE
jgi:hypothetical protein